MEFRLWKQGRVNIDNLCNKLSGATSQATWDIIMEYFLLKTPLCERNYINTLIPKYNRLNDESISMVTPNNKEVFCKIILDTTNEDTSAINFFKDGSDYQNRSRKGTMNSELQRSITFDDAKDKEKPVLDCKNIKLDCYEMGDEGVVTDIYAKVLNSWLEFGFQINAPSIRKTFVLNDQHLVNITIKELQALIVQLTHDAVKFFTLELDNEENTEIYVPYVYSHSSRKCLVISRNFEQWKGSSYYRGSLDFPDLLSPHTLKHVQKFEPIVINDLFIPRQKILWGIIETDNVY